MSWTVHITIDGLTYPVTFDGDDEPSPLDIAEAVGMITGEPFDTGHGRPTLLAMTTWADITSKPGWADLEPDVQAEVRRRWIVDDVAPSLADDPDRDAVLNTLLNMPFDSGQPYAASLANAAARGPLIAVPKVAEWVGSGLGIPDMAAAGEAGVSNVQRALPVNPIHASSWPVTVAPWFIPLLVLGLLLKRKLWPKAERPTPMIQPELRGVHGWLKFWCIVSTFLGPLQIFGRAGSFAPILGAAQEAGEQAMASLIWLHLAVALCFAVGASWVAVRVWKVRTGALLWLRRFWWALVAWQGAFVVLFITINPRPYEWRIDVPGTIASAIAFVAWWFYFANSKRVASTFGPWSWAAYQTDPWPGLDETKPKAEAHPITTPSAPPSEEPVHDDSERWKPASSPLTVVPTVAETTRLPVDALEGYEKLAAEQRAGFVHEALWLKCISECDGDETKATAAYNRQRAAMLAGG